jgi:hypothetical protein
MGTSTSWNPLGLSRPVMGLLYLYLYLYHAESLIVSPSVFEHIVLVFVTQIAKEQLVTFLVNAIHVI